MQSKTLWIGAVAVLLWGPSAAAQITPPFHQCPPVGADTSCAILIVVTDKAVNVYTDPSQGPFDTIEDTLIGVQNNSSGTLYSLPFNSPNPIFAFDGDGICGLSPITGQPYSPAPPACPYGPTTYEGPVLDPSGSMVGTVSFSGISSNQAFGIVNFVGGVPSGGWAYFSLELAVSTVCPALSGQPLGVNLLLQNAGCPTQPWGVNTYDDYTTTYPACGKGEKIIAALGCATTSAAMIVNYFAGRQVTDPGALNTWLAQNNGYSPAHNIDFGAVAAYSTNVLGVPLYYQGRDDMADDFTVDNYLCAGDPVILVVTNPYGTTHFVVAKGGEGTSGGGSTYLINDPYYNCSTLDAPGCYNNQYNGTRKFTPGPSPLSLLVIEAESPAELLVAAPNGQETGFDPVSGQTVQEIPSSSYGTDSIGDDSGGGADTPTVKRVEISTPADGQYTVQVIGTGSGGYTLWFAAHDLNGTSTTQTITGSVTPGQILGYQASYSSAPGSQIIVTPAVLVPPSGSACNGTYQGTFQGDINVSGGQTCTFVAGGITGNITVTGGSLVLDNSSVGRNVQVNGGGMFSIGPSTTIIGNLEIHNLPSGTGQNQVCGTTVRGNLEFHNNGTAVQIGSALMSLCPGNATGGNLEVHDNSAQTVIFGNSVTGNLHDHNNTGSTQVFKNAITNDLQCENNTAITGEGNTAKQKQGQCANF